MYTKFLNRPAVRIVALISIFALGFLTLMVITQSHRSSAIAAQAEAVSYDPLSPTSWFLTCTVKEVAVTENRIHVLCTTAPASHPTVFYFVYPAGGTYSDLTNRYLAIMNTAFVMGKPLAIEYNNLGIFNPPSCDTSNCRGISFLAVVNP